jgi:hypothetical protein
MTVKPLLLVGIGGFAFKTPEQGFLIVLQHQVLLPDLLNHQRHVTLRLKMHLILF